MNVSLNLMEENVIQINGGITLNVNKSIKEVIKTQNFNIFYVFLLITIALLIAISICCYLIKY